MKCVSFSCVHHFVQCTLWYGTCCMNDTGNLAHSACTSAARSFTTCIAWFLRTLRPNSSQTYSMGLRSGLFMGQSKTLTLFIAKNYLVIVAECGRVLSCIKVTFGPWNQMNGRLSTARTSFMLVWALIFPINKSCFIPLSHLRLRLKYLRNGPAYWRMDWQNALPDSNKLSHVLQHG